MFRVFNFRIWLFWRTSQPIDRRRVDRLKLVADHDVRTGRNFNMMMRSGDFISQAELADLKARNPVTEIAARYVRLRRHGEGMMGPCPMCSLDPQKSDSTRIECDADKWVCAVCTDGGDVISLVKRVEHVDFLGAVEWLGGARRFERAGTPQRELARQQHRLARARQSMEFREKERRERERRALFAVWRRAVPVRGTPVEDYLHLSLTLADLGGVCESVLHSMPDMARNFYTIPVWPGHERNLMGPYFAAHGRDGIAEGQDGFWIPSSSSGLELS
jgi:hypothetical protein